MAPSSVPATSAAPRRSLVCRATAAKDLNLYNSAVPTPVLPSGAMMAEFLMAYRRMLEHEFGDGDHAAAAGFDVLERVRVGLNGLLHHPKHGAATNLGQDWVKEETEVEVCLGELEKDISYIGKFHDRHPPRLAVEMASVHCSECARLLRHL